MRMRARTRGLGLEFVFGLFARAYLHALYINFSSTKRFFLALLLHDWCVILDYFLHLRGQIRLDLN